MVARLIRLCANIRERKELCQQYTPVATESENQVFIDDLLGDSSDEGPKPKENKNSVELVNPQADVQVDDSDDANASDLPDEDPFASPPSSDEDIPNAEKHYTHHSSSSEDSLISLQLVSASGKNSTAKFTDDNHVAIQDLAEHLEPPFTNAKPQRTSEEASRDNPSLTQRMISITIPEQSAKTKISLEVQKQNPQTTYHDSSLQQFITNASQSIQRDIATADSNESDDSAFALL